MRKRVAKVARGGSASVEKLRGDVEDLRSRVVRLEAQGPHIDAMLARIEKSVDALKDYMSKAIWIILGLFITALWRLISNGSLPGV